MPTAPSESEKAREMRVSKVESKVVVEVSPVWGGAVEVKVEGNVESGGGGCFGVMEVVVFVLRGIAGSGWNELASGGSGGFGRAGVGACVCTGVDIGGYKVDFTSDCTGSGSDTNVTPLHVEPDDTSVEVVGAEEDD